MESDGLWKHNTQLSEVAKKVTQWSKTDVPNLFEINPEKAERKIMEVLKSGKIMTKVPVVRRGKNLSSTSSWTDKDRYQNKFQVNRWLFRGPSSTRKYQAKIQRKWP